jgi:hypothetical protein
MSLFYRVSAFGQPRGPWRSSRRRAQLDAVDLGLGEFDEWGRFYVAVPGDIEWIHENQLRKIRAGV